MKDNKWVHLLRLAEGCWFQLSPVNSPPPRSGAGMAYDASTKTVLFQWQRRNDGGDLNDIGSGTNWTRVFSYRFAAGSKVGHPRHGISPTNRKGSSHWRSHKRWHDVWVTRGFGMGRLKRGRSSPRRPVRPLAALLSPTTPQPRPSCSLEVREAMLVRSRRHMNREWDKLAPAFTGELAAAEVHGIRGL